jgi:hypothetical protein
MEIIALFLIIAVLVEAVWENLKLVFPKELPLWLNRLGVMVLAVFVCIVAGADMFETFGVYLPWSSGAFFSGILCSRGANYLHDVVTRIGGE